MMGRLKRFKTPKINTVIGNETRIEGNLKFSGGLHVDGFIRGNVVANGQASAALILSEQGVVEGDVRVPNIVLNGKVVGDVYSSERVELASNAKVTGTLYYAMLEMAMGAEVNGQLISSDETSKTGKDTAAVEQKAPDDGAKETGPTNIQAAAGSINTRNS